MRLRAPLSFARPVNGWRSSSAVYVSEIMAERFDIESEPDGTWSVIDNKTGLPYEVVGLLLESIPFWLALDLVGFLNDVERQRKPH